MVCRLALHVLLFSNARAIAGLWQRFVLRLRLSFWNTARLIPHVPGLPPNRPEASTRQQPEVTPSAADARDAAAGCALQAAAATDAAGTTAQGIALGGNSSAVKRPDEDNAVPQPDFSCCMLYQKLQMLNLCIQQAHGLPVAQAAQDTAHQVGKDHHLSHKNHAM